MQKMDKKQTICMEAIEWIIPQMPDSFYITLKKSCAHVLIDITRGGFKINRASINSNKILFNRFANLLSRFDTPIMLAANWAVRENFESSFCFILSLRKDWLRNNWRSLLRAAIDPRPLAIALNSEGNSDSFCRILGRRLLRWCPSLWRNTLNKSRETDFFWCDIAKLFLATQPKTDPAPLPPQVQQDKALRKQIDKLKQQLGNAKSQISREQLNNNKLKSELEFARKNAENERIKAQNAALEAEDAIQKIRDEYKGKLKQEYNRAEDEILGINKKWMSQAFNASEDADELLMRADFLLEQQAQSNKNHATRSQIRQRIKRLKEEHGKMVLACRESVILHPGALQMFHDIENMILKLHALLEEDEDVEADNLPEANETAHIDAIIKEIHFDNDTPGAIDSIRHFIEQAESLSLITPQQKSYLFAQCAKRMQLWHNLQNRKHAELAPRQIQSVPEIWNPGEILAKSRNTVVVVIDAYNVIFRSSFWAPYGNEMTHHFTKTRHTFITYCKRKKYLFAEMQLVFDGEDIAMTTIEREPNSNVTVIFAQRAYEEHNADNYIKNVFASQKKPGLKYWLVTDDFELRFAVGQKADAIVPVRFFNELIITTKKH